MENENNQIDISPEEFREQKEFVELNEIYFQAGDWYVNRENLVQNTNIKLNYEIECLKREKKQFKCRAKFKLQGMSENKDEKFIEINCNLMVEAFAKKEVSENFWKAYEEMTVPILTVPYFREHVFSLTGKMGIPPIRVPHWTP